MGKVAPLHVDNPPAADEVRDVATAGRASHGEAASPMPPLPSSPVAAGVAGSAQDPKSRPIDRAKMNIRRGSRRVIQLFETKPEVQLDLDQFYTARLRRRTHLEKEITGHLARGGLDPPEKTSESETTLRTRTRGIMMSLSPGEEYENYHKVDLATKFQQASLLGGHADDGDSDDGEEDIITEGDEDGGRGGERGDAGGDGDQERGAGAGETMDPETMSAAGSASGSLGGGDRVTIRKKTLNNNAGGGGGGGGGLHGVTVVGGEPNRSSKRKMPSFANLNSPTIRELVKRATLRAQAKEFALSKKMINPHGRLRLVWDLLSIAFILYNAFVLPFRASFDPYNVGQDQFDSFLDIFFIFDILVMFNTAVEVDGSVRYSRRLAARSYLTSWFLIDTVAAIPYDEILPQQGTANISSTFLRSLKLLRLIRLLRLLRISRIFRRIQNAIFIRSTLTALAKYILAVTFVSHWFSCVFHAMASGRTDTNWITTQRLQDPFGNKWDRYIAALYFSVMTLATIGFGDVAGSNADERLFAIFAMIIGGGIFAYGITNIVELVSSLTVSETRFRQKMDEVNEYMAARELPLKVRMEIREFYHNTRQSRESKLNAEQHILGEISSKLRSKIALSINDQFLRKFPFFTGSEPNFLMELALNMRMIHFAQLEDVIVEGEIGHEMFFIFRGAVEVLRDNAQIGILGENQYFGEMAILSADNRRRATVRTLCFCELRMLSRNRFLDALALFPAMQTKMAQVARSRQSPQKASIQQGSPPKKSLAAALQGGLSAKPALPEKNDPQMLPPPKFALVKQQSSQRLPIANAATSASMRLLQNDQRTTTTPFVPVRATTSARLNVAVRRSSAAGQQGGISASMAQALSETTAKLEEATRRQEMLVNTILKLHAELEKLGPSDF